ncbi:MAG: HlyD family efflux transporter periplasmic adaptor subunit [Planctomycetales bacterium]|nr:HlyD family efflux transporter periplasmic adaptor subunit [Planctomycetales bacterium]
MSFLLSAAERRLPFLTRGDLQFVRVERRGERRYVVSDPLTREYFEISSLERAVLERLRRPATLSSVLETVRENSPTRRTTLAQVEQFVTQLYQQRLLLSESQGQGASLVAQSQDQRRSRLTQTSPLAIRLARIPVSRWLVQIDRVVGGAFSWLGGFLASALALAALAIVAARGDEIWAAATRPNSFGPFAWLLAVVFVKFWHELGHAVACRRMGAECGEIGVMLLVGLPTLYCDVSDTWRLPEKRRRMIVAAGGMAAELVLASICIIVWSRMEAGPIATWLCQLAIVCSLGTLLVNANPLLRYDGYYLVADAIDSPNLAQRAGEALREVCRRWFFGDAETDGEPRNLRRKTALVSYAVASRVYLLALLTGTGWALYVWSRRYGCESVALIAVGLVIVSAVRRALQPIIGTLRDPWRRGRLRLPRAAVAAVAVAIVLGGVWRLPIVRRVAAPCVVTLDAASPVFAQTSGALRYSVAAGTQVEQGDVLYRLADWDLERALVQQETLVQTLDLRCRQLATLRTFQTEAMQEMPAAEAQREAALQRLAEFRDLATRLVGHATQSGIMWSAPVRRVEHESDALQQWHGDLLDMRNRGAWVESGSLVGMVGDPRRVVVQAGVDQADAPAIREGLAVRIVCEDQPTHVWEGVVRSVSRRAQTDADATGRDATRYHVAVVELAPGGATLSPGMRGMVKIETYRATFGELVRRQFNRLFITPW